MKTVIFKEKGYTIEYSFICNNIKITITVSGSGEIIEINFPLQFILSNVEFRGKEGQS